MSPPALTASRLKNRAVRLPVLVLLCLMTSAFGGLERQFAPDAALWEKWTAHDAASTRSVDHRPWSVLLREIVVDQAGLNTVRYGTVIPDQKQALSGYLDTLAETPVSRLNRAQQFAYWINLYNALTIKIVLDAWPVETIKDINISPGLFASGPWDAEMITVEGEALTLNAIEHQILRPIWADPRIHYAVNCASIGCPDLQAEAFTAENTETLLEKAARAFINDSRGVQVRENGLTLSSIYDWFYEDFGGSDESLLAHLAQYAEPTLAEQLKAAPPITQTRYDWSINNAD